MKQEYRVFRYKGNIYFCEILGYTDGSIFPVTGSVYTLIDNKNLFVRENWQKIEKSFFAAKNIAYVGIMDSQIEKLTELLPLP